MPIYEGTPLLVALEPGRPATVSTAPSRRLEPPASSCDSRLERSGRARAAACGDPGGEPHRADRAASPAHRRAEWARGELLRDARLMVHYAQVRPGSDRVRPRRRRDRRGGARRRRRALPPSPRPSRRSPPTPGAGSRSGRTARTVGRAASGGAGRCRAPGHLPSAGRLGPRAGTSSTYSAARAAAGAALRPLIGRVSSAALPRLGIDDEDTRSSLAGRARLTRPAADRCAAPAPGSRHGLVARAERALERGRRMPFAGALRPARGRARSAVGAAASMAPQAIVSAAPREAPPFPMRLCDLAHASGARPV